MTFIKLTSYQDFLKYDDEKKWVLVYKSGTPNSDCAYDSLAKLKDAKVFLVDVNEVRDVHQHLGVKAVPSLVLTKDNKTVNIVKGCQTENYFDQIIHEKSTSYGQGANTTSQKRVVVYSTPSCTYCNKLKQYFNKHNIRYTDINVATNQQAATEMVRKSGQRGVPQTEINGQIIVGFDVPKLSRILNIPTE